MDYTVWAKLMGKAADDPQVMEALRAAGVTKRMRIGKHETDVRADIDPFGMTIVMTDEAFVHGTEGKVLGAKPPLLTLVTMFPKALVDPYRGRLPCDLQLSSSRDQLRARFGTCLKSNDSFNWDMWQKDGRILIAFYSEDLQSVDSVSFGLPTR